MLLAQTESYGLAYQSLVGGRGGRGITVRPLTRTEAGKPFSATVTTQTTQTLSDGTRVSQTTTTVEFRDAEGRVRSETQPAASSSGEMKVITIRDPVAGVTYRLDPAQKSALKLAMPGNPPTVPAAGGRGRSGNAPPASTRTANEQLVYVELEALRNQLGAIRTAMNNPNETVEDLGTATVNGVPARGTRLTTVVPVGAIGNDREFRGISERWFSSDLNLLVKSVNTDPRFGTTTYELTNISRQPPDPSLFQVPAGYDVVSNGGRQPQF